LKVETFSFDGLPFEVQRKAENAILEIRNLDGVLIGLIDTSTSKQALTSDKIAGLLGDRADVLTKQLRKEGLIK
jgi:hypothetical protein